MKFTIKLALIVSLFCSTAVISLADDGEMGNGTRTCQTSCLTGGQPTVEEKGTNDGSNLPDIYEFLKDFLNNILG